MTGFSGRGRNNGPRRGTGEFGFTSPDEAPESVPEAVFTAA